MGEAKKVALVTGGAGFIGSHMVDLLLKENIRVRCWIILQEEERRILVTKKGILCSRYFELT